MDAGRIVTLAVLCVTLLGTPGPATITLAACGANIGVRQSVPYVLGLSTGVFVSLVLAVGGVGVFLVQAPGVLSTLQICSACYLFYLAYRLARDKTVPDRPAAGPDRGAEPDDTAEPGGRAAPPAVSFDYRHGVVLNIINPKIYLLTITLVAEFIRPGSPLVGDVLLVALVLIGIEVGVDLTWCYAGGRLRGFLATPRAALVTNRVFAAVLVVVTVVIIAPTLTSTGGHL